MKIADFLWVERSCEFVRLRAIKIVKYKLLMLRVGDFSPHEISLHDKISLHPDTNHNSNLDQNPSS